MRARVVSDDVAPIFEEKQGKGGGGNATGHPPSIHPPNARQAVRVIPEGEVDALPIVSPLLVLPRRDRYMVYPVCDGTSLWAGALASGHATCRDQRRSHLIATVRHVDFAPIRAYTSCRFRRGAPFCNHHPLCSGPRPAMVNAYPCIDSVFLRGAATTRNE